MSNSSSNIIMEFIKFVNDLEPNAVKVKDEKVNGRLNYFIGQLNSIENQVQKSKLKHERKIIFLSKRECGKNAILSKLFGFDPEISDQQNFFDISATSKFRYELQIHCQELESFDSVEDISQRISAMSTEPQSKFHVKVPILQSYDFVGDSLFLNTPSHNLCKEFDGEIVERCRAPHVILLVASVTESIGFKEISILKEIIDKNSLEKIVFIFTDLEKILKKDIQGKIEQHSRNANDIAGKIFDLPSSDIFVMFVDNNYTCINELKSICTKKIINDFNIKEKQKEFVALVQEFKQFIQNELNEFRTKVEKDKNLLQEIQSKENREIMENIKKLNSWIRHSEELIELIKEFWEKIKYHKNGENNLSLQTYAEKIMSGLIRLDSKLKVLQIDNLQSFNQSTIDFVSDLAVEIRTANRNQREIRISDFEIDAMVVEIVRYNSQFDAYQLKSKKSFSERIYKIAHQIHENISSSTGSPYWKESIKKLFDNIGDILSFPKNTSSIANICLEIEIIYQDLKVQIKSHEMYNDNILFLLLIELLLLFSSVRKQVSKSYLTFSETISWHKDSDIINLLTTIFENRCGLSTLESIKDIRKEEIQNITCKMQVQPQAKDSEEESEERINYLKAIEHFIEQLMKVDLDSMTKIETEER